MHYYVITNNNTSDVAIFSNRFFARQKFTNDIIYYAKKEKQDLLKITKESSSVTIKIIDNYIEAMEQYQALLQEETTRQGAQAPNDNDVDYYDYENRTALGTYYIDKNNKYQHKISKYIDTESEATRGSSEQLYFLSCQLEKIIDIDIFLFEKKEMIEKYGNDSYVDILESYIDKEDKIYRHWSRDLNEVILGIKTTIEKIEESNKLLKKEIKENQVIVTSDKR